MEGLKKNIGWPLFNRELVMTGDVENDDDGDMIRSDYNSSSLT